MSRRQKRRLLRTIAVVEAVVFAFGLAATAVVVLQLRVNAWGVLAALAVIALYGLHRFENGVRREPTREEAAA